MSNEEIVYITGDRVEVAWGKTAPGVAIKWKPGRVRWANPIIIATGQLVYVYTVDCDDGSEYQFGAGELRKEGEMKQDAPSNEPQMSEEHHIVWYLLDVLHSWGGEGYEGYIQACNEFPPAEHHLPSAFRAALLDVIGRLAHS